MGVRERYGRSDAGRNAERGNELERSRWRPRGSLRGAAGSVLAETGVGLSGGVEWVAGGRWIDGQFCWTGGGSKQPGGVGCETQRPGQCFRTPGCVCIVGNPRQRAEGRGTV